MSQAGAGVASLTGRLEVGILPLDPPEFQN